jgi:hypothetical protein
MIENRFVCRYPGLAKSTGYWSPSRKTLLKSTNEATKWRNVEARLPLARATRVNPNFLDPRSVWLAGWITSMDLLFYGSLYPYSDNHWHLPKLLIEEHKGQTWPNHQHTIYIRLSYLCTGGFAVPRLIDNQWKIRGTSTINHTWNCSILKDTLRLATKCLWS